MAEAEAGPNPSLDSGCLMALWVAAGIAVLFVLVIVLGSMGSSDDEPSGDACTRAFIKDTELLTRCYQLVGTGVSAPEAVVIVRNTVRDYGRP